MQVGGGATAQTQHFPNIICRVAPWRAPHGPLQAPPAYGNPAFVRDHYTAATNYILQPSLGTTSGPGAVECTRCSAGEFAEGVQRTDQGLPSCFHSIPWPDE